MIEQLLTSGVNKGQVNFPESGPGNKRLKFGTADLGFFGEVSASELFDGYEVANWPEVEVAGTDARMTGLVWLKFVRNGKFLFIAKEPIKIVVSWNGLYASGLVYGVRGGGLYPGSPAVDQLIPKLKMEGSRKWWLKPRLLQGMVNDPYPGTPGTASNISSTEWDDLIPKITTKDTVKGLEIWGSYRRDDLQLGTSTLCKESSADNLNNAVQRGSGIDVAKAEIAPKSSTVYGVYFAWRPVLELTDVTGVAIKVDQVSGEGSAGGLATPAINNPIQPAVSAQRINGPYGYYDLLNIPAIATPLTVPGVNRVNAVGNSNSPLASFSAKASYVA